ncbi:MAG: DnaJ domain-containing protein [Desulfobacterales bacterium]|nr:MAG: DnaJ domain-containing protein [Desulfobacterales bacterium]
MSNTDYYKILGVDNKASDSEIKKAYRKLAMKYHPDRTKGDKSAEEMFKKVSEAYAVLSDKEKRKQYDTFGASGFRQRYSQEDIFQGFNFGDIFKEFGFDDGSFANIFMGSGGAGRRFGFSFGGDPFRTYTTGQRAQVKGSDLVYELPLTLQEVLHGTTKTIALEEGGQRKKINVKLPKGMVSGKKLRLAGKGQPGTLGGPPGDLYIQAKVLDDPVFSVVGHHVYIDREVKLTEALLGTQIQVPTIDGKHLNLKIPPGTQHQAKFRMKGYGLPEMKTGQRGDLYARILVKIPKRLTKKQKNLIQDLSEAGV